MPRNAIGTGAIDFVLPVDEMPQKLIELWRNAQQISIPRLEGGERARRKARIYDSTPVNEILSLLRTRTGHDFSQYKPATVIRRIERRLQVTQLRDLPTYRDYLRDHPAETRALLDDMLISVTMFFRDPDAFDALESVLPRVFDDKRSGEPVRAWVAGCATGEEAYSIAMLLAEQASVRDQAPQPQVFATDVDEQALTRARAGYFPPQISGDVTPARLKRFMTRDGDGYRVSKSLRQMLTFAKHNILKDPPLSRLDLVCCRNLLINLNRDAQQQVLDLIHFALRPDGYLFLGPSETVSEALDAFTVIDKTHRIYRRLGRSLQAVSLPPWPRERPAGTAVSRASTHADVHRSLLDLHGPASILGDDRGDFVHLSEGASRYLRFAPGEPSVNVVRAMAPGPGATVRAALYE